MEKLQENIVEKYLGVFLFISLDPFFSHGLLQVIGFFYWYNDTGISPSVRLNFCNRWMLYEILLEKGKWRNPIRFDDIYKEILRK